MNIIESATQSTNSMPANFWVYMWITVGLIAVAVLLFIIDVCGDWYSRTVPVILSIAGILVGFFALVFLMATCQTASLAIKYDNFKKIYYEAFAEKTANNEPIFYYDIDEDMRESFYVPKSINTNKPIEINLYVPSSNYTVFLGEIVNVDADKKS